MRLPICATSRAALVFGIAIEEVFAEVHRVTL
jgi:hypothetical protein